MTYTVTATFDTAEEAAAFLSSPSRTTASPDVAKAAAASEAAAKPKKAAKAAEPETAKAEPVAAAKEETKLDFTAIRGIIEKNTQVNGLDSSKAILSELGFVKASAIPESKYPEVYAKFEASIDGDE